MAQASNIDQVVHDAIGAVAPRSPLLPADRPVIIACNYRRDGQVFQHGAVEGETALAAVDDRAVPQETAVFLFDGGSQPCLFSLRQRLVGDGLAVDPRNGQHGVGALASDPHRKRGLTTRRHAAQREVEVAHPLGLIHNYAVPFGEGLAESGSHFLIHTSSAGGDGNEIVQRHRCIGRARQRQRQRRHHRSPRKRSSRATEAAPPRMPLALRGRLARSRGTGSLGPGDRRACPRLEVVGYRQVVHGRPIVVPVHVLVHRDSSLSIACNRARTRAKRVPTVAAGTPSRAAISRRL